MTERPHHIWGELRPHVDDSEAEDLSRIAKRLQETDPEPPSSAFRAELKAHLIDLEGRQIGVRGRPRRLRVAAIAYLFCGLGLLAIAALAALGSGPLA